MASKALLLPHIQPRLVGRVGRQQRAVVVYRTTCIVTAGNLDGSDTLVNPGNPGLTGTADFSYFPRGGPVPPRAGRVDLHHIMPYVSNWGGLDVSRGMLVPESVIDGLVHQHGGWRLRLECAMLRLKLRIWGEQEEVCPVGSAVATSAGNLDHYERIVHTTPPFYYSDNLGPTTADIQSKLLLCYQKAWKLGFSGSPTSTSRRIATPLLGAGCRGFPLDVALSVAVQASAEWLCNSSIPHHSSSAAAAAAAASDDNATKQQTVVFGLLEEDNAKMFVDELSAKLREIESR